MNSNQLYPIIRRIRRPLVPVEPEPANAVAPAVVKGAEPAPVATSGLAEPEPEAVVTEGKATMQKSAKLESN
jgi:hypothetical protein